MKDFMPVGILVSAIVYAATNSFNAISTTAKYLDATEQVSMKATTTKDDIVVNLTYNKNQICGYPTVELKKHE